MVDFTEFKKQDKRAWKVAAEQTLKGKPLDILKWKVDDQILLDPYYTAGDEAPSTRTLLHPKKGNQWHIGESFNADDPVATNDLLLKALAFGLDSPLLFDVEHFDVCLQGARLDFLFPVFRGGQFASYLDWIQSQSLEMNELEGAFIAYESDFGAINIIDSLPQIKAVSTALPQYFHSHFSFAIDPEDLGKSIGAHLIKLSDLIFQLKSHDIPVKIICEIECDNDFIKTISVIRALRLLICHICDAYGVSADSILLDAYVYQTALDTQLGMIGASSQALAAVTAGVDGLTISCETFNVQQDEESTRRMARNVHHLMKMESGLDQVVDPLAGSYTIEELTGQIAKGSWKVFQKG